ncbi:hypothetical protein [Sodalis glossinidius]|uniref:hypothetical protein n=1 Tax=Sodalis glossinidius TaxID=63612 RepID=UPI0011D1570E|nr:hypothetical protein [Sodalis glossinidius]
MFGSWFCPGRTALRCAISPSSTRRSVSLPRLSWRRQGERYQVILTLGSATSLEADATDFLAWLET